MDLPDHIADAMLTKLKPTDVLVLLGLFRKGERRGDDVVYTAGVSQLVPSASDDALSQSLRRLEAAGFLWTAPGKADPTQRGRPPKMLIARATSSAGFSLKSTKQRTFQGNDRGSTEANHPAPARAFRTDDDAGADDVRRIYPEIIGVMRLEGVTDPEDQVRLHGQTAAVVALGELLQLRIGGGQLRKQPKDFLVDSMRRNRRAIAVPAARTREILANWPAAPPRLRAVQ